MDRRTIVKIAKALADPTRLGILHDLRKSGEMTCSCVCERFALSQPTISHHLRTLERAGVVRSRRDGLFRRLTVDEELLGQFAAALAGQEKQPRGARSGKGRARAKR